MFGIKISFVEISDYTNALRLAGSIYVPKERHDEISYPSDGNEVCFEIEDGSFWFSHRNRCILEVVKKYHDVKEVFFDVGGGNGFVTFELQKGGYTVCLVEPGSDGTRNAKSRGVKNIIQATFNEVDFLPNRIGSVGLFDVLEHIDDVSEFLMMIKQKLKPTAKLFLTVPAHNFLWSENDVKAGHYRRYTVGSLSELLEACGFSLLYSSYIFSWLVVPIFLMRTLPSRLGVITQESVREQTLKHHKTVTGVNGLVRRLMDWEVRKVSRGKNLWTGSSCLAVAQKR